MVLVLKKEVVKTNNAMEHEDVGKYRQLLVRTLHQCSVKFPDVAATVIPVVSFIRLTLSDLMLAVNLMTFHYVQNVVCHCIYQDYICQSISIHNQCENLHRLNPGGSSNV